jgi:hypothetical protein
VEAINHSGRELNLGSRTDLFDGKGVPIRTGNPV